MCWQLLPRPYTKEEWETLPLISYGFWVGNFHLENLPSQKMIDITYGSMPYLEILVRHEQQVIPGVHFYFMNLSTEGRLIGITQLDHKCLVQSTQDPQVSRILVIPPSLGIYAVEIVSTSTTEFVASLSGEKQLSASAVIEYQLNIMESQTPSPTPIEKFPHVYSTAKLGNFFIVEPLHGELPPNTNIRFKVGQKKDPWAFPDPTLFILDRKTGQRTQMKKEVEVGGHDGLCDFYCCSSMTGAPGQPLVLCLSQGNSFPFLAAWDII